MWICFDFLKLVVDKLWPRKMELALEYKSILGPLLYNSHWKNGMIEI